MIDITTEKSFFFLATARDFIFLSWTDSVFLLGLHLLR